MQRLETCATPVSWPMRGAPMLAMLLCRANGHCNPYATRLTI